MVRARDAGFLVAVLALALTSQAGAVTWFTINGNPGGTITTPGSMVLRADTASPSNVPRLIIAVDSNQNGAADPGEPVVENLPLGDGAYDDEDANPSVVQLTMYVSARMSSHFAIRMLDQDGSWVDHAFDFFGAAQPQSVSGAVRDQNGSPVAGAMVRILRISGAAEEHMAFADANGAFALSLPAARYEVQVNSPGFRWPGIFRVTLAASQPVAGVNFVLDTSALSNSISGKVLGPGSEPVPGALIGVMAFPETWASTDINGDYMLPISPGDFSVLPVETPQGYYYTGSGESVSVPPDRFDVNFSLASTSYYCYGTVTDSLGAPIPGAQVEAGYMSTSLESSCNQFGKYVLFLPPGVTWIVGALADGYSINSNDLRDVSVPPNTQVDFTLTPNSVTVSGQVFLEDAGGPVPYAFVQATIIAPPWDGDWGTRADANGNYLLHVPAGAYNICAGSELLGWFGCVTGVDATSNVTGLTVPLQVWSRAPSLSNGSVSPQSGPAGATFTFHVTYTDPPPDNGAPAQVYLVLDGWPRQMIQDDLGDTDYTNGAGFHVDVSDLAAGSHSFWFGAIEQGVLVDFPYGYDVRLPGAGSYAGPGVGAANDPSVAITSPANGAAVKGQVTITASASDPDGIQKVEFYDGATLKSTDASSPYQWAWDTKPLSVAEGAHTICTMAYDNTGHTAQACIQVTVDNTTFDDVPKTSSQWPYIEALVRAGITSGCSTNPPMYCPISSITRAQMAVFLCRAAGKGPLNRDTPTFADVPKTNPYYAYVERLADAASWSGTAPTSGCRIEGTTKYFCPNSPVTREQMAKFLCIATSKIEYHKTPATFGDVPVTHPFHGWIERLADAASWGGTAVTSGCAAGPPPLYCPSSNVTRGQIAVFIVRAFSISI